MWLSRWYSELGCLEVALGLLCSFGVALLNLLWRQYDLRRCSLSASKILRLLPPAQSTFTLRTLCALVLFSPSRLQNEGKTQCKLQHRGRHGFRPTAPLAVHRLSALTNPCGLQLPVLA